MKKWMFFWLAFAVTVGANGQRFNRLNLGFSNDYQYFGGNNGQGNRMMINVECLPALKGKTFGIITSDNTFAAGVYYSGTIKPTWEDKKPALDTSFDVTNFQQHRFGLMGIYNMGQFHATLKAGLSLLDRTITNKFKYNIYIDSVFSESRNMSYAGQQKATGYDVYLKVTRYSSDGGDQWFFRNSVTAFFGNFINFKDELKENGVLIKSRTNIKGYGMINVESNITDLNLSDKVGFDPRVSIGLAKGANYIFGFINEWRPTLGASLSLVPRLNRENDNLDDAVTVNYEWQPGSIMGGQVSFKVNLLSLGQLIW